MTEADIERILCEAGGPDQEPIPEMTADDLKRWRADMGQKLGFDRAITQREGAERLGISYSAFCQYELEKRRGLDRPMVIPNVVALACAAVLAGLRPYGAPGRKR